MKLVDLLPKSMIVLDLKAKDKKGAIRELIGRLVSEGRLKEEDAKKVERAVNKREGQGSTGIGKGLAIPHAKDCGHINQILGVFARSLNGVSFDAVDGGPVYLIFLVVSPDNRSEEHLGIMRKIATLHRDEKTLKFLMVTDSTDSVVEIFKEVDDNFH